MKTPPSLQTLIDEGVIVDVMRPLKSGKEAAVYVVRCGDDIRCAKVYKDMAQRSFQKRVQYQEGRKSRGSRESRAVASGSRYGRRQQEAEWKNAEVDALYQLREAGVRVPEPFGFFHGVLVMELVTDADGFSAPRLGEVELEPDQARDVHAVLVRQVVRMLCCGLIHGDLSAYNVLVAPDGPVVIDFPQVVSAAGNNAARAMLLRDVAHGTEGFDFVPAELEVRAAEATKKAVDVILAAQVRYDGRVMGWPQQVEPMRLVPTSARNYEPRSVASGETTDILIFLMGEPNPTPEMKAAIRAGIEWLQSTRVYDKSFEMTDDGRKLIDKPGAGPIWSRNYDIVTGRPIFGDKDQTIHDDVNGISIGRRNGYAWWIASPQQALDAYAQWSAANL
mgnify:CR=1 FL=1